MTQKLQKENAQIGKKIFRIKGIRNKVKRKLSKDVIYIYTHTYRCHTYPCIPLFFCGADIYVYLYVHNYIYIHNRKLFLMYSLYNSIRDAN